MSSLKIDVSGFENLQKAMREYQGNTENVVNDVLHNEAGQLIHDAVKKLIPVSGKDWKGKKQAASKANSLLIDTGNLSVTVRTKTAYNYLYFPDDGTNTRNHIGKNGIPQEFFKRGGESQTEEIVNRCINKLVNSFEDAIN